MSHWVRSHTRGAAVAAVAVVLTLGLVAGGVLAQTPPATATPTAPGARPAPLFTASDFFAKLAGKLGLDAGRVQTAANEVQKEEIDAAVQAGRLTADAATRLKARVDAGDFVLGGKPGGRGGHGGPGGPERGLGVDSPALATWLGITPDQLRTEMAGKSLAQVAQARGKTRDALITFLTDQIKARLAQAVTAGRLTQAQADAQLARFQQSVGQMVDQVHQAGGPDGPDGPRGSRATPTPTAGA